MDTKLQVRPLIRDLEHQDIPTCLEIENSPEGGFPEWEFFSHMTGSNLYTAVAELDGKVLGFMLLSRNPSDVYIDYIAVAESARGQGVGPALLTWLKKELPAFKRKSIALDVAVTNASARRLYSKMGFAEGAVQSESGYRDGSESMEMVFGREPQLGNSMRLDLVGARCS